MKKVTHVQRWAKIEANTSRHKLQTNVLKIVTNTALSIYKDAMNDESTVKSQVDRYHIHTKHNLVATVASQYPTINSDL